MSTQMIRRASELDKGSRVVLDNGTHEVASVKDLFYSKGGGHSPPSVYVSITFTHGGCIIDRASTLFTCEAL